MQVSGVGVLGCFPFDVTFKFEIPLYCIQKEKFTQSNYGGSFQLVKIKELHFFVFSEIPERQDNLATSTPHSEFFPAKFPFHSIALAECQEILVRGKLGKEFR